METDNRITEAPAPMGRAYRAVAAHYEQTAVYLLLMWCMLPVIMCFNFVIQAKTGKYAPVEKLLREGLKLGKMNHKAAIESYQLMFFVLGGLTLCFALLCLVLSWRRVFSRESVRRKPWFYLFALMLIWATVSAARADYKHYAFFGGEVICDGLVSYYIYAGVFLCASTVRQEKNRKMILRVYTAVICFLAMVMLVQEALDMEFLNYCFPSARAVVFNQFNHFGYMLCMASVIAAGLFLYDRSAGKGLRLLYLAAFFFLLYALTVNDTFGAMLAVILSIPALLLFYLRSGRKLNWRLLALILLLAVLCAVGFFLLAPNRARVIRNFLQFRQDLYKIFTDPEKAGTAGTGRFGLWKATLIKISKRPLLGFGPEGLLLANALPGYLLPHNAYLQIAAYLGIPGLVYYLAAIFLLAGHHWKRIKSLDPMVLVAAGAVFAYLVSEFVGVPVFNTEPYFWLFLGLMTVMSEREKPLLCLETSEA